MLHTTEFTINNRNYQSIKILNCKRVENLRNRLMLNKYTQHECRNPKAGANILTFIHLVDMTMYGGAEANK